MFLRRQPSAEVVGRNEYQKNGRTYRELTFASGSTSTEILPTRREILGTVDGLTLLIGAFIGLATAWILTVHAILGAKLPLAALIPTHIVGALTIAWAAILFGGMSESKWVAARIILVGPPLVTIFIVGVANFF